MFFPTAYDSLLLMTIGGDIRSEKSFFKNVNLYIVNVKAQFLRTFNIVVVIFGFQLSQSDKKIFFPNNFLISSDFLIF